MHVGCGADPAPAWLAGYDEVRLDIDASHSPHIVASMTCLGDIGQYDMVYCSHALEHLLPHEVQTALGEFKRVLKPNGGVVIMVPDLEDVPCDDAVLYESPAGPIRGADLYYGFRSELECNPYMAHKTGFVATTLQAELEAAGFRSVTTKRLDCYNLMGAGLK